MTAGLEITTVDLAGHFPPVNEEHIMELAAISTAALQNTRDTTKLRIGEDHPYWTPAYADTCRAVDREIEWREKYERLREELAIISPHRIIIQ